LQISQGRTTRELLDLIDRIGETGAAFQSLGDPPCDRSSAQGRLLSTLPTGIAELNASQSASALATAASAN
jgi:hypothetical protein